MESIKLYLIPLAVLCLLACSPKTGEQTLAKPEMMKETIPEPVPTPVIRELAPLKEKDILMVHGGWQGHKPKEYTDKIGTLLRESGATVTLSPSTAVYEDSTFLSSFDLIIQSVTMDKISDAALKGLLSAVKTGKTGFAGCHGGAGDSFRNHAAYQYMVGGQFVDHPGGHVDYTVQITNPNDNVTQGLNGFSIHTEQYYMHVDPNVKVLATTQFSGAHDDWIDGATMPIAWKKYYGEGRVFYFSIGHDPVLFDEVQEARTILMRGIQWASGSKYEEKEEWLSPMYPIDQK